jgi:hypothetical protein
MATPYLWYTNFDNSATITNHGSGGAAYNGTASSNLYKTNSVGHPMWGPMTGNADRIAVPGGISNPYNHTWEIGLNIQHWWPVNGVQDCILVGNDGKLWAAANDQYYGYLHEICSWDGDCSGGLTQTGVHNFTVEIQGASSLDVQFWLGVGNNKPTQISPQPGSEGALYVDFDYDLKLNTNYYFQISVNANGPTGDYYIGNCAAGCADASVAGFPCGCYIYCWREYNTAIDLSGGGDWAADVPIWAGGTPPNPSPSPTPGPGPGSSTNINMNASVREYQPGNY